LGIGSAQFLKNLFVWWHVRRRAVWINAGASVIGSVALWGATVAVCYAIKTTLAAPAPAQLVVGAIVVGCVSLIHVRGPALSASDRDILLRLFQGREVRLLRVLGLVDAAGGTLGTR
jgi:hypothetical protein